MKPFTLSTPPPPPKNPPPHSTPVFMGVLSLNNNPPGDAGGLGWFFLVEGGESVLGDVLAAEVGQLLAEKR